MVLSPPQVTTCYYQGGSILGTYFIPAEESTYLCTRSDSQGVQFQLKMVSSAVSQQISLYAGCEEQVVTCQADQGSQHTFLVSLQTRNKHKQVWTSGTSPHSLTLCIHRSTSPPCGLSETPQAGISRYRNRMQTVQGK